MHTLVEMNAGNGVAGAGQGAHVPAFLAKLWKLVDDPATNDMIYWSEPGNSFVIRNQAKFSRELLPLYYKHNNMASFVRQLNMYGFHKVVSVEQGGLKLEKDEMEFAHPFFLRGNEASLELIKRKIPAPKHDESRRPDNIQKVLLDVRQMKGRQENMDSRLLTMKRENEALWRELAALRQKHANQTTILSKILQFLVGVMSSRNHRLGFKRRMPLMLNDADETKAKTRRHKEAEEQGQVENQPASGPVIHDVTELFEDSDGNGDDYSSGGGGSDPIPQVDSPLGPESILGLNGNHLNNAEMLLAVNPSTMNPHSSQHGIPSEQGFSGKVKSTKKRVQQQRAVDPLAATGIQRQQQVEGIPVSIEESEGNSADGYQPVETMYYITGANGEPLRVCLTVPDDTASVEVPTSTIAQGIENMVSTGVGMSNVTATASSTPTTRDVVPSRNLTPQFNLKRNDTISKKEDFDAHLDDMQLGLDNLRDILKSEEYKMDGSTLLGVSWPLMNTSGTDPLHQLFGDGELNLDFSKLNDANGDAAVSSGQELVSYNPSLFELTEDDSHFFDDSSNMFLDDELQSMLTTDREKLKQPPPPTTNNMLLNGDLLTAHTSRQQQEQQQQQQLILTGSGLSTPIISSLPAMPQSTTVSGAGKRKRK